MNIIDLHCDTLTRIDGKKKSLRRNDLQIDLERLKQANVVLQHFAIYLDGKTVADMTQSCYDYINLFNQEISMNSDLISHMTSFNDYLENKKNNKISALLTIEDGDPVKGNIDLLEDFYHKGVRMMTLTWNYQNDIGYPNASFYNPDTNIISTEQKGLTKKGIDIVRRMNELGMIIDVSHGSDKLVDDLLLYTDKPFVASHSNAREVCFHFRNLSNRHIKAITERGGLIGMNFADSFISPNKKDNMIDGIIQHMKHIQKVASLDVLALGSDFDGIPLHPDFTDVLSFKTLIDAMEKNGFSYEDIEKVCHKNVERMYYDIL